MTTSSPTSVNPLGFVMDGAAGCLLLVVLVALYAGELRWAPDETAKLPPPPPPPVEEVEEAPPPPPPVLEPPPPALPPVDPIARVQIARTFDNRFGLSTTTGNPDDNSDDEKKLTFSADGSTNNTRVWIDGDTPIFGHGGKMLRKSPPSAEEIQNVWSYRDIEVTQLVKLVAGDISRRMDGVQVTYQLKNTGTVSREVGLRVMIDSLIGGNDGVPFIVPGREGIIRNATIFSRDSIPDFVRALERPVLSNPGVIVDLGLKSSTGDRPDEVVLTHWPGNNAEWNYNRTWAFDSDSAIGLYYTQRPLAAGADRSMTFTYGLGSISSTASKNAQLSLTAGGPFQPGKKFWLVALVQKAGPEQKVTVEVPAGFKLDPQHPATKTVRPSAEFEQISWLIEIEAGAAGEAEFAATLEPGNSTEKFKLNVDAPEKGLRISPIAAVKSGKKFWVSAQVRNPGANQSVEIQLPTGFSLVAGHDEAIKPVAPKAGYAQVDWLIKAGTTVGSNEIKVKSMPGNLIESAQVVVTANLID